jgi:hypothetical protein
MDFGHQVLNTILITFQKRLVFKYFLKFSHNYDHLNEIFLLDVFFVKSHEHKTLHMELKWYN